VLYDQFGLSPDGRRRVVFEPGFCLDEDDMEKNERDANVQDIEQQSEQPEGLEGYFTGDTELIFQTFMERVRDEIARAREQFKPFHSKHEGLSVLQEEVEEVKNFVYREKHFYGDIDYSCELIQVAAMVFCNFNECAHVTRKDWLDEVERLKRYATEQVDKQKEETPYIDLDDTFPF
jgi:hypothetical protein